MDNGFGSEELRQAVFEERKRLGITSGSKIGAYMLAMFSHFLPGLEGKRILDIGCGGDYSIETRQWPPIFPRLAAEYGVQAVGIDPSLHPKREKFEAHKAYAQNLNQLFEPESFDGTLVRNVWNEPGFSTP